MSLKVIQNALKSDEKLLSSQKHILFILPENTNNNFPFKELLNNKIIRSNGEFHDLTKNPITLELPNEGIASYVILKDNLNTFQRHTLLRKALKPLLEEQPSELTIFISSNESYAEIDRTAAYYVAMVNSADLPSRKKEHKYKPLDIINIFGLSSDHNYESINARVLGNTLCRQLTITPPNELSPTIYRNKISELADIHGWKFEEFDMDTLKKMGSGAFYAVGQGSNPQDAAIVHLTYTPESIQKTVALVGKGICFDTGGHNLKPAKYMQGMHEDMNGSAVVLGILLAATQQKLDIKLDCWLAISQNHIGPQAYKQNDVVTALNGMTIEIVHTDAEGRMVLADTLTLASRNKPDAIISFATLTGSMITALGDRMSGIISNQAELLVIAKAAGDRAGERVIAFPYDDDYDSDLESDIADIKQCSLEGEADHIHAARFLGKFIDHDIAWLHMDLSSAKRKDGLGAVQSDTNGFGVGLGLEMLSTLLSPKQS